MTSTQPVARIDAQTWARFRTRADAAGLVDVAYTTIDTPLGRLLLAGTRRGLVRIAFPTESPDDVLVELAAQLSPRLLEAPDRLDGARRELDSYFEGRLRRFEVALDRSLMGTFARRVLGRTARIPYGEVLSYSDVAVEVGTPRGARAVGNALGSNPIPIIVPCHRVVRTGGALGGYGGGLPVKRWLLTLEGALAS